MIQFCLKCPSNQIKTAIDLPIHLHFHAMASLNESISMLIGGESNQDSYLSHTWYFVHATQEFMPGPNLIEGKEIHKVVVFGLFLGHRKDLHTPYLLRPKHTTA